MFTDNEANPDIIVISSDEDQLVSSDDEACDDRKKPVVLAILPAEKRVFTPTKKRSCLSDSDSEIDEAQRYVI